MKPKLLMEAAKTTKKTRPNQQQHFHSEDWRAE